MPTTMPSSSHHSASTGAAWGGPVRSAIGDPADGAFTDVTLDDPVPAEELDEPVGDGADQGYRPEDPTDTPEPDVS